MSAKVLPIRQPRCRICDNPKPLSGIGLCFPCMHLQIGASGAEIEDQTICAVVAVVIVGMLLALALIPSH